MSRARVRTDPRISRRRRAVVRARRRTIFTRGAILITIIAVIYAAFWSPLLKVRSVRVVGARHTTTAEVVRVIALGDNDNILTISTAEIEERAETLPWVDRAEVDRRLPGTVRVKITERKPAAILAIGAARWTLDAGGRVLASGTVAESLPILGGVPVDEVEPGATLTGREVQDALKALASLPGSLEKEVRAIFAPTIERITFSLADGTLVRYGAAHQLRAKNRVLLAVMARIRSEGREASYIDVRVPTSPAIAPVAAAPAVLAPAPPTDPDPAPSPRSADEEEEKGAKSRDTEQPADATEPADPGD